MANRSGGKQRKPVKKLRFGLLSVSIWKNDGKEGPWYSTSIQRSYKNDKGDWEYSESMNHSDLLPLALILQETYKEILLLKHADRKEDNKGNGRKDDKDDGRDGRDDDNEDNNDDLPF